ncbi:MAG: mucoidy inhibitor MuiA family protein, partial [Myxococcales bacterium]|nr:mucoidy inhibitor MuiA family protein [Myxococcales bacterium]
MVVWLTVALAGEDFAAEARKRMRLEFDLDAVEAKLSEPAAPMASWDGSPEPVPTLPLEPNSALHAVTVFRDRAFVHRSRTLDLPKGTHTVVFEGLPHRVLEDGLAGSVVRGKGRIVGVELVSTTGEVPEGEALEALRAKALGLTGDLGEVRDTIESLLTQRAYLRTTLLAAPGDKGPPPLGTVRETLAFVGSSEADLAKQLREQEARAKDLAEELQPLLVKMEVPAATGRQVRVEVASDGGQVEVGLRYQVTGASWTPTYNARLLEGDRVELEYFGVVRQDTGESWTDAELALSTATTSGLRDLPTLSTWWVGGGGEGIVAGTGVVSEQARVPAPEDSELVETRFTAAIEGSGAVVYRLPGARTVAGDGSSQRVGLGSQVFTAHLDHAAVPKLAPEVHRRARICYDGPVPLLPGTLSTFVGTDFVGS